MAERLDGAKVLIYSHDTFGLGHLRRCRAIAHSLVDQYKGLSVLILTGSPIIGSFDFRARVDFVRIPGVIKLHNGEYTSLGLHIELDQTMAMRAAIIKHTAEAFDPDLFIVDKEPLGLKGEVAETLEMLKARGCRLVLGLRDVIDDPEDLSEEWTRKGVLPALERLYDEIWVYGLEQVLGPFEGLDMSESVRRKTYYTSYLPRTLPQSQQLPVVDIKVPYILVTPGGGGDGAQLVDWVLTAYERDGTLPYRCLLVLGPFMQSMLQQQFQERVARLGMVEAIVFDSHIEFFIARAAGMVTMGGYNTFCEILSFNKRALIVPRTAPRREQFIRAIRAHELGLTRMLDGNGRRDPLVMARALHALPAQSLPSETLIPGLLDGLINVNRMVEDRITSRRDAASVVAVHAG